MPTVQYTARKRSFSADPSFRVAVRDRMTKIQKDAQQVLREATPALLPSFVTRLSPQERRELVELLAEYFARRQKRLLDHLLGVAAQLVVEIEELRLLQRTDGRLA